MGDLASELRDARARETATSEILRVINRSPTDYQPVFEAILENATRLCDAPLALLLMRRDDAYHLVAHAGTRPELVEFVRANPVPLDPEKTITAKAAAERRAIEVLDIADEKTHGAGQPVRRFGTEVEGIRTQLTVPMLRGGEAGDGDILLSARAYAAVEERIEVGAAMEVSLKGFHEPVEAFPVTALRLEPRSGPQ